jgi:hypothetical protein
LSFGRFSGVSDLQQNNNGQQEVSYQYAASEQSKGVIDRLIDKPRESVVISVAIGALTSAIGIAFYLNGGLICSVLGGGLFLLGMLTPIIPWWLLASIWWAGQ